MSDLFRREYERLREERAISDGLKRRRRAYSSTPPKPRARRRPPDVGGIFTTGDHLPERLFH